MTPEPHAGGRPRDPEIDERVLTAARELLIERGLLAMSLDAVAYRDTEAARRAIRALSQWRRRWEVG
jgi:hypothetical protein